MTKCFCLYECKTVNISIENDSAFHPKDFINTPANKL